MRHRHPHSFQEDTGHETSVRVLEDFGPKHLCQGTTGTPFLSVEQYVLNLLESRSSDRIVDAQLQTAAQDMVVSAIAVTSASSTISEALQACCNPWIVTPSSRTRIASKIVELLMTEGELLSLRHGC